MPRCIWTYYQIIITRQEVSIIYRSHYAWQSSNSMRNYLNVPHTHPIFFLIWISLSPILLIYEMKKQIVWAEFYKKGSVLSHCLISYFLFIHLVYDTIGSYNHVHSIICWLPLMLRLDFCLLFGCIMVWNYRSDYWH